MIRIEFDLYFILILVSHHWDSFYCTHCDRCGASNFVHQENSIFYPGYTRSLNSWWKWQMADGNRKIPPKHVLLVDTLQTKFKLSKYCSVFLSGILQFSNAICHFYQLFNDIKNSSWFNECSKFHCLRNSFTPIVYVRSEWWQLEFYLSTFNRSYFICDVIAKRCVTNVTSQERVFCVYVCQKSKKSKKVATMSAWNDKALVSFRISQRNSFRSYHSNGQNVTIFDIYMNILSQNLPKTVHVRM